jgi:hypothetical protein
LKALSRRRPIFPQSSIFGADVFNFSVRNGKRWVHIAIITETVPSKESSVFKSSVDFQPSRIYEGYTLKTEHEIHKLEKSCAIH